MLSHNTRPAAVDPEAGRLQIKAAIKDRNFSAAMALQAQLRGINTSLWPTALGLKTTAELAQGDPRRNWHAFDRKTQKSSTAPTATL